MCPELKLKRDQNYESEVRQNKPGNIWSLKYPVLGKISRIYKKRFPFSREIFFLILKLLQKEIKENDE